MSGFRFHPSARMELAAAARFYRNESPGLGRAVENLDCHVPVGELLTALAAGRERAAPSPHPGAVTPTAHSYAAPGPEPELETLHAGGELSPPLLDKGGWTWEVKGRGLPPGTAAVLLERLREDR